MFVLFFVQCALCTPCICARAVQISGAFLLQYQMHKSIQFRCYRVSVIDLFSTRCTPWDPSVCTSVLPCHPGILIGANHIPPVALHFGLPCDQAPSTTNTTTTTRYSSPGAFVGFLVMRLQSSSDRRVFCLNTSCGFSPSIGVPLYPHYEKHEESLRGTKEICCGAHVSLQHHALPCVPPCDYICKCSHIAFRINISDLYIYIFTLLTLAENLH